MQDGVGLQLGLQLVCSRLRLRARVPLELLFPLGVAELGAQPLPLLEDVLLRVVLLQLEDALLPRERAVLFVNILSNLS